MTQRQAPPTRYTRQRNTASLMRDLIENIKQEKEIKTRKNKVIRKKDSRGICKLYN